jgi:hypothetical protein
MLLKDDLKQALNSNPALNSLNEACRIFYRPDGVETYMTWPFCIH